MIFCLFELVVLIIKRLIGVMCGEVVRDGVDEIWGGRFVLVEVLFLLHLLLK